MESIIIKEVKVTRNRQIIIPKEIAEKLNINVGNKDLAKYEDGKIVIIPKKISLPKLAEELKLKLGKSYEDTGKVIAEAIDELVEQIKKEYLE